MDDPRIGSWYPDFKLRLFRKDQGSVGGVEPHDQVHVDGPVKRMKNPIWHYTYNDINKSTFQPEEFLKLMKPYSRVAAEFPPVLFAYLQDTAGDRIFGSNGRSIILHGGFKSYLSQNRLIQDDLYAQSYHFASDDTETMEKLGIKYYITRNPEKFPDGRWGAYFFKKPRHILSLTDEKNVPFLFENRKPVSVAYLTDGKRVRYLSDVRFAGNTVRIRLPEDIQSSVLVLTFVNWPGFKAVIDGNVRELEDNPEHLLKVRVDPPDKTVTFSFEPFSVRQLALCFIAGALLLIGTVAGHRPGRALAAPRKS